MYILPILRLLWFKISMAANSAPPSFLFPEEDGSLPIPACHKFLVTEELNSRIVAVTSRVRNIAHLKQSSGPYHELLLVDVVCDTYKGPIPTYILIERYGEFAPRPSGRTPFRSVASNSFMSLSDGNASDVAWFPGPNTRRIYLFDDYISTLRRRGYQLLRTAIVSTALSAAQLIVMAKTLRDKKPVYRVLDGQCYWYAGMLLDMVEKEFHASIVEHIPKAGKYKFVRITTIDPTAVTEVLETYGEAWERFTAAEDKNDDVSKKVALEEERRAWEEERKQIDAARSAMEQERKALDHARILLEEAERRGEEDRRGHEDTELTGEELLTPQTAVVNRQIASSKPGKGHA